MKRYVLLDRLRESREERTINVSFKISECENRKYRIVPRIVRVVDVPLSQIVKIPSLRALG